MEDLFEVALIGQVNVGKSTLFNALLQKRKAIVSSYPGTTRDRNKAKAFWRGYYFNLVDTGGFLSPVKELEPAVLKQAQKAINSADLILLILDGQREITAQEKEVAYYLKKSGKKTLLVINKIDSHRQEKNVSPEIYQLGLGKPYFVSAATGRGCGDLLDALVKFIPSFKSKIKKWPELKIAIIGKPNVGKSSLINTLIKEERVIVSPYPLTTRDAQEIELKKGQKVFRLIDTAGIRRKTKVGRRVTPQIYSPKEIEEESIRQSLDQIKKADVILLVVDGSSHLTRQDKRLARLISDSGKKNIIIVNKIDLLSFKSIKELNYLKRYFQGSLPGMKKTSVIFVSAKTGQNVDKILKYLEKIS